MSYFPGSGDLAGTTADDYDFDAHTKDRVSTYTHTSIYAVMFRQFLHTIRTHRLAGIWTRNKREFLFLRGVYAKSVNWHASIPPQNITAYTHTTIRGFTTIYDIRVYSRLASRREFRGFVERRVFLYLLRKKKKTRVQHVLITTIPRKLFYDKGYRPYYYYRLYLFSALYSYLTVCIEVIEISKHNSLTIIFKLKVGGVHWYNRLFIIILPYVDNIRLASPYNYLFALFLYICP